MLSEAHTRGGATEPFSVEVLGTLSLPADARPFERWIVTCESRAGSFFLWLDDHLVCEGGNGQPRWNPFRLESVLPFNHDLQHAPQPQRYFLRATFVQQPPNSLTASGGPPSFSMSWQRVASSPTYQWTKARLRYMVSKFRIVLLNVCLTSH